MDDLIGEFITETAESLAVLDQELVKLEYNPNDQVILGNIFRLLHTIKGTCGFLGLLRLETVASAAEEVINKIKDGKITVTHDTIEIILGVIERIRGLIEGLQKTGQEEPGDDSDLLHFLNLVSKPSAQHRPPSTPPSTAKLEPVAEPAPQAVAPPSVSPAPVAVKLELEEPIRIIPASPKPEKKKLAPIAVEIPRAAAKPELTPQVKQKAIKQGLKTQPKEHHAVNSHTQVNPEILEELMQMVGDLVQTRNQLIQLTRHREEDELSGPLRHFARITSELQQGVMKTRRQPLGNAWSKLPRLVRDLGNESGKKIDLTLHGEETEMDRQLLEQMSAPLFCLVRYCCEHGLENPADRRNAQKPEAGLLTLRAYQDMGHIVMELKDDGRGISCEQLKKRMLKKNLATEEELSDIAEEQVMAHLFLLDKDAEGKNAEETLHGVHTALQKLGGEIRFQSSAGKGFYFEIKLPVTASIMPVVLVEVAGHRFAIPQMHVREVVRIGAEHKIETISHASMLRLRGELLPLKPLAEILSLRRKGEGSEYAVVLHTGSGEIGLLVDHVLGNEEIVVKPIGSMLKRLAVYSGSTVLGDGSAVLILDSVGLAAHFGHSALRKTTSRAVTDREQIGRFLIVSAAGSSKAIPLDLVLRVEKIATREITSAGIGHMMQYQGNVMRLHLLPGCSMPSHRECEAILFAYDGECCALVVDSILDVASAPLSMALNGEEHYLGSGIIGGKAMDIVNVGYLMPTSSAAFMPRNMRILLVEDNPFFRKLLVSFFQKAGCEVIEAISAEQALSMVPSIPKLDAVITDLEMPGKDGFEFASMLRSNLRLRHTPIIALSSTPDHTLQTRAASAGLNAVIAKTNRKAVMESILSHAATMAEGV